ncbi:MULTISPECIES: methyl-accepting chemotaxis protein [Bacillus]|uniref:Methyl-accepting chemotaxis protein n=4 Tax=Bacillus cereus group TaxID=86661 RepID=A0A2A7DEG5_BACAN|nr:MULTISPECIES: methyl-accepting chemotaxis protein [Bacillus]MCP1161833.1 methyl-accepting chemotaxis protein [Bacillus sp. 1813sda1]OTW70233.1 methyl-accepting chemotaxis protein [Bacillus thuringiensis serovar coreanensis]OTX47935.1 methyl-accepting chemotaxis protein [Bacillus thuringiensis serovar sooncheon]OTX54925.1 methyl-accepting chemotaxis protein [Bacillus thuringiensis serovar guiyangiensis]OTX68980.1 methyl-accepting chemotaxis protein [Bacillus thuringiensis serovar roskildiens
MEKERKKFSFGLRMQLMLFTTILAFITYSTSLIFIYVIYDYFQGYVSQTVYNIIVMLLGVVWSGILAYGAAIFLIKPLRKLEEAARKAADGDIREDVPLPKTDDEIKSLSVAFNMMLGNLRGMVQNIDTTFSYTNNQVQQIRRQTGEATKQARGVSETLAEISSGAEQSAASIQAIVSAVDTTTSIASEVEEKAKQSDELSLEMVQALGQSTRVFTSLIQGIQTLAKENENSMQNVQKLEDRMKQVEHIVSVVSEIASQTNLLALNASIEAARAGEHGRGFAVVAEEVRKLADESDHSARNISQLLRNMQEEVRQVALKMTEQVKTAKEEAKRGEATELILKEMSSSVMEVADATKKISGYMNEQVRHIHQTGAQTKAVAAIAEETSAGSQEVARVTLQQSKNMVVIDELLKDLEQQAADLKQTIERFSM